MAPFYFGVTKVNNFSKSQRILFQINPINKKSKSTTMFALLLSFYTFAC